MEHDSNGMPEDDRPLCRRCRAWPVSEEGKLCDACWMRSREHAQIIPPFNAEVDGIDGLVSKSTAMIAEAEELKGSPLMPVERELLAAGLLYGEAEHANEAREKVALAAALVYAEDEPSVAETKAMGRVMVAERELVTLRAEADKVKCWLRAHFSGSFDDGEFTWADIAVHVLDHGLAIERENFTLAAGQCSQVVGGDGGSPICNKDKKPV
jgi:hypothetical protein